jgi:hypothetical protein
LVNSTNSHSPKKELKEKCGVRFFGISEIISDVNCVTKNIYIYILIFQYIFKLNIVIFLFLIVYKVKLFIVDCISLLSLPYV